MKQKKAVARRPAGRKSAKKPVMYENRVELPKEHWNGRVVIQRFDAKARRQLLKAAEAYGCTLEELLEKAAMNKLAFRDYKNPFRPRCSVTVRFRSDKDRLRAESIARCWGQTVEQYARDAFFSTLEGDHDELICDPKTGHALFNEFRHMREERG
jgi:hypothetical protein